MDADCTCQEMGTSETKPLTKPEQLKKLKTEANGLSKQGVPDTESLDRHKGRLQEKISKRKFQPPYYVHPRLNIGSSVQLQPLSPRDGSPPYGVIRWIGDIPGVQGPNAGIELVCSHSYKLA